MATLFLDPDQTLASAGTLTGGATHHGVLSDANDATWVELWAGGGHVAVSVETPTKPAGSMVKHARVNVAVSSISVNTTKFDAWFDYLPGTLGSGLWGQQIDGTDVEIWSSAWVNIGDLTDAQLGAMALAVKRSDTGAVTNLRARGAQIEVVVAEIPTTTITGVSVAPTATTVTWSHTAGTDGGGQSWYRAWLTDSLGGVVFDTGISTSGATSATATGLAADTYTWHVQTAQSVNGVAHWSAGDTDTAVIAAPDPGDPVIPAAVDTIVTTPDALQAVVEIEVTRDTGWDDWTTVDIERLNGPDVFDGIGDVESGTAGIATGWQSISDATPTTTIESGSEDASNFQRFDGTVGAGEFVRLATVEAVSADPDDLVAVVARVRATVTGTAVPRVVIGWTAYPAGPGLAWNAFQYDVFAATAGGAWNGVRAVSTAPAGTRSFLFAVEVYGGVSGGDYTVDFDQVRSAVSSAGWVDVRHVPAPNADDVTAYDYEAPPDQVLFYRARATNSDESVEGTWAYAVPVDWTADDLWLTPVSTPSERSTFRLAVPPSRERVRREQRLNILGSRLPVFRSDVLLGSEGEFVVITATEAEADALEAIAEHGVVVVHAPAAYRFPSGYYRLGSLQEVHLSRPTAVQHRRWRLPFTECRRP